jgi:hypothetical protein
LVAKGRRVPEPEAKGDKVARRPVEPQKVLPWLQVLQATFTIIAIALAGYWYFVERRDQPHADLQQKVEAVPLGDGRIAVEAHVTVRNLGRQLLEIDEFQSRLQIASTDLLGMSGLPDKAGVPYWSSESAERGDPPRHFTNAELRWPQLNFYKGAVNHRIEPGESDLLVATFILRCPDISFLRVASDIPKPEARQVIPLPIRRRSKAANEKRLMWKTRSFVDIREACRGEESP